MAVNKPVGANARRGAVKRRWQMKTSWAARWTKRDRASDEFMAMKKPAASKRSAKKIKGVRAEKKAGRR
jgi:hypothetical protein